MPSYTRYPEGYDPANDPDVPAGGYPSPYPDTDPRGDGPYWPNGSDGDTGGSIPGTGGGSGPGNDPNDDQGPEPGPPVPTVTPGPFGGGPTTPVPGVTPTPGPGPGPGPGPRPGPGPEKPGGRSGLASNAGPTFERITGIADRVWKSRNSAESGVLRDKLSRALAQALEGQGHAVKWQGEEIVVDGRRYVVGSGMGGESTGEEWMPSGQSSYVPGTIGMEDIPNFSFESLMQAMATPEVDSFMSSLMQNPESMDALTVDRMKATSKDELAAMSDEDEQLMGTLAQQYGIQESPWLGAQQLQGARSRDNALIQSNRAIDMKAAETNFGDRMAVGQLAQGYAGQQQSKVMAAASTALSRSAAIGDRLALRETVDQKAAELKISAESLLASHVQHKLDSLLKKYAVDTEDSTKRWGISVDSATRLSISAEELAMADRHSLEELAMRTEELESMERKFAAEHELNWRRQTWLEERDEDED